MNCIARTMFVAMGTVARTTQFCIVAPFSSPPFSGYLPRFRFLHGGAEASPVTLQMIAYALSLARSQKSEESYAQGLLVLEQCLANQLSECPDTDDSKGLTLLAMSTLSSERGDIIDAVDKLQKVQDLAYSSLGVKVAAMEALVGLHLQQGQDDTASMVADKCLEVSKHKDSKGDEIFFEMIKARARAVKGLVELVNGNLDEAGSLFEGFLASPGCAGSAALSYGEYLHITQNFTSAKEAYRKVMEEGSENKHLSDPFVLASCNMSKEEVFLGATCLSGQLESHLQNFAEAEEILTRALTKTEKHFGSHHPKVGIVLTCIALMFRDKAVKERSSSLLIQEGLYRKALEMLKAPSLGSKEDKEKEDQGDVVTLATGAYSEILQLQQNRKAQGEKMKTWALHAWRNRRLSLAEALDITEPPSKVLVVDYRIGRAI